MQKPLKILLLILAGILLVLIVLWINNKNNETPIETVDTSAAVPVEDPLDTVLTFYNDWLQAEQSTTTDPIQAGLLDSQVLTPEVRANLEKALAEKSEGSLDPVLCQPIVPVRIGAKVLFALDMQAQIMVLARGGEEKSAYQAVVTLKAVEGTWRISEIACTHGDVAPEQEHDFEREGFLLKSVPPPLDSQYWHLVYEENGQLGHTIPLFFSSESICISANGSESGCDPAQFTEAAKVLLQADMTEAGAQVKRIQFK